MSLIYEISIYVFCSCCCWCILITVIDSNYIIPSTYTGILHNTYISMHSLKSMPGIQIIVLVAASCNRVLEYRPAQEPKNDNNNNIIIAYNDLTAEITFFKSPTFAPFSPLLCPVVLNVSRRRTRRYSSSSVGMACWLAVM